MSKIVRVKNKNKSKGIKLERCFGDVVRARVAGPPSAVALPDGFTFDQWRRGIV